MRLYASQIATAADGRLVGPDRPCDGASIDSRTLTPGQLFAAVIAERDGHTFARAAVQQGASALLVSRELPAGAVPATTPLIVVADTTSALAAAGRLARGQLPDRVVAITGSVGKTTAKDLTAAVLAQRWETAASERSFNNELGVPLTLLNASESAAAAVVEMGARSRGDIAALVAIARPQVGVVTCVAGAHTQLFGSLDEVAAAKAELIESLPADGVAVLNADDRRVAAMAECTDARVVRFGAHGEVSASAVQLDDELRLRFLLHSPVGSQEVRLGARGAHNLTNALAAAAVGVALDLGVDDIAAGLVSARLSVWRMQLARTGTGAVVINDAYNANPTSVRAALEALAALPAERRIAVLGPMAELGSESAGSHAAVAAYARRLSIEVLAVGTDDYDVESVADIDAAIATLGALRPTDAVLVKASRIAGLEVLAARLAES